MKVSFCSPRSAGMREVGRAEQRAEAAAARHQVELLVAGQAAQQAKAQRAVEHPRQQPPAAARQQRPDQQLDQRLLVGDRIGQPVAGVERRSLLERHELAREDALRAEGDLDVLKAPGDPQDRRHARREGDHLEALEALEQAVAMAHCGAPPADQLRLEQLDARRPRGEPAGIVRRRIEEVVHGAGREPPPRRFRRRRA